MEIVDKYLQGSSLVLVFDQVLTGASSTVVEIDYAQNLRNNSKNSKHDLVYNSPLIIDKTITIQIPSEAAALLFINVYIDDVTCTTMFLNSYMLYRAQNEYLSKCDCCETSNVCRDCNEKKFRMTTILMMLRIKLLNYAYTNQLVNDSVNFYTDLCRILEFGNIPFECIPTYYDKLDYYAETLL